NNTFEIFCNLISSVLFEIATNPPKRGIVHVGAFKDTIDVEIDWNVKAYKPFIIKHMGLENCNVRVDGEHVYISLMLYWLASHIFSTKSLQVPKSYYNLTRALHVTDEAVNTLLTLDNMKNIVGPFWLIQLWLNALLDEHIPNCVYPNV
ncbi:hypothetical protein CR513_02747, partial [Mucuna pruriens]